MNRSRTSIIGRSIVQEEFFTDNESNESIESNEKKSKLLSKSSSNFRSTAMDPHYRTTDTSETIFDIYNRNSNNQSKQHLSDDEDLRNDTNFVVNAMNQSHESLRKLVSK